MLKKFYNNIETALSRDFAFKIYCGGRYAAPFGRARIFLSSMYRTGYTSLKNFCACPTGLHLDRLATILNAKSRLNFPILVFVFGFVLFYLQVSISWWQPDSVSSSLLGWVSASILFFGFLIAVLIGAKFFKSWLSEKPSQIECVLGLCLFLLLVIGGLSSLRPPHLPQESDFLNYHFPIPQHHWLRGNWSPMWSSKYEFFVLCFQYALSFLWMGLPLLAKLPHFLFVSFIFLKTWNLFSLWGAKLPYRTGLLACAVLFSFRGINIQVGMAMLDLPSLYFIAGILEALLQLNKVTSQRNYNFYSLLLGLHTAGYLGYKGFAFSILLVIFFILTVSGKPKIIFKRLNYLCIILPIILFWIPNLIRSFHFTGDPFFPLFPSLLKSQPLGLHQQLEGLVQEHRQTLTSYGFGRDWISFIKSFFLVAFSNRGSVNNAFDYPLGMTWILSWILLVGESKWIPFALYCLWFLGPHQSRWLYPCIFFLSLFTGYWISQQKTSGWIFRVAGILLCGSLIINSIRIVRSQGHLFS